MFLCTCCNRLGAAKLRVSGRIRPAKYFAHFFTYSSTFPTLGISATALAAACHVNCTVSGPPVAMQTVAISALGSKRLATPVHIACCIQLLPHILTDIRLQFEIEWHQHPLWR